MYRQGLGDCFLLTLPRTGGGAFHLLFDCGVIVGTEDAEQRMRQVVQNIIDDTGGRVDVLVVTHEHYDHLSGFLFAEDLFLTKDAAAPDETPPERLAVGEVWFAWTEDPNDSLARRLRTDREARLRHLTALTLGLREQGMAAAPLARGLEEVLGFFGVDLTLGESQTALAVELAAGKGGDTQRAMKLARDLVGQERVFYRRPGEEPWESKEVEGFRIYVLGPPRDPAMLSKTYAKGEVYHIAEMGGTLDAFFAAETLPSAGVVNEKHDDAWDDFRPFDAGYINLLPGRRGFDSARLPAELSLFLNQHYLGPSGDPSDPDQSWRRIDEDWLGAAAEFALQLDAATNNTSLVLAIEATQSGRVLLFAADAQVGSWLSWQNVAWGPRDGRRVTGPDLLSRTVFYKVGHHGSENATARAKGLELMPDGDLIAFVPVDHSMAVRKHWLDMPLPSLMDGLERRTGGRLVRIDAPFPLALGGPAAVRAPSFDPPARDAHKGEDPLYYECEIDLRLGRAHAPPGTPAPTVASAGAT